MKVPTVAALAMGVVMAVGAAAPAYAVTFADYSATSSSSNIIWTQSASGTGGKLTTTGGAAADTADVKFSFLTPSLVGVSSVDAVFAFKGRVPGGNPALTPGSFLLQDGLHGTFSFTYSGPAVVIGTTPLNPGDNLLSGRFKGGNITGKDSATAGSVNDATSAGGFLRMQSDFLDFGGGDRAYSIAMTSIADPLRVFSGMALDPFSAVSAGNFQANTAARGTKGIVPEPTSWALMIVGFGGVGFALRRRTRSAPGAA